MQKEEMGLSESKIADESFNVPKFSLSTFYWCFSICLLRTTT